MEHVSARKVTWDEVRGRSLSSDISPLCISFLQQGKIQRSSAIYELRSDERDDILGYAVKTVGLVKIDIHVTIHEIEPPLSPLCWSGLIDFAKREGATSLVLELLGQRDTHIPHLANESHRENAKIYVLDLRKPNSISSNHRRNIKKAKKNNVCLIDQPVSEAIDTHLLVSQDSGERRQTRGEHVAHLPERLRLIELLNGTRPAKIAQAAMNGKVVSSMLIVYLDNYAFLTVRVHHPRV